MARNNMVATAKKLILAMQHKYEKKLTMSTKQWHGTEGKIHTTYMIKESVWNVDKQRYSDVLLFKTCSTLQLVLFLRDMFYTLEGRELPTDNEIWNNIREQLKKEDY